MKRYYVLVPALIAIAVCMTNSRSALTQSSAEPELPRIFLSTQYPANAGVVLNVPAGGNLQSALNSAQAGDTIVLQAGATYSGNFVLPAKSGSDWIVIRTSNLAGISPEHTRISPANTTAMPRIVTPNAAPAMATAAGSHHYRFVGLEIGIAAGVQTNYGIVALGDSALSNESLTAHDMIVDRCYIHGNQAGDVSRGIALNSASTAVIDSYISAIHGAGFDTQALAGWNGRGPFKIVNNYLEASGENVMFGGADPRITGLIPSDIEFRRNYCTKPLSWNPFHPTYAGVHWSVKNVFELKNAQRVLIDGNVFENCWIDAQTGFVIVFTPRNQEGTAPWSAVQDITFTNNVVRHGAAGIQFLGHDDIHSSQVEQRIRLKNNLLHDIGGPVWGGNGRLFQIIDGPVNLHIDHNTALQTSNIITVDGEPGIGFAFTNNITPHNDYGVMGSGRSPGNDSLNYYFPGCSFLNNAIIGGPVSIYPSPNFFPSSVDAVGFVDAQAANYRLAPTSAYKNAGTDGSDIGADLDAIEAAIGGDQVPTGNQPPQVVISASATSGVAPLPENFIANASDPDGSIGSYFWDFGDGVTSTQSSVLHIYQSAGNFTARVTVADNLGATATASVVISVTNPPLPPGSEIVLYASEARTRVGAWTTVSDASAAGKSCIWNPDAGAPKLINPLANPASYFEMSFYGVAGRAYRLWVRGRAQSDSPYNDSVFVQFSGSVDSGGAPVFRIGTTDATTMNLEDCSGCGLQRWGWQDNGWDVGVMGPLLYFAATGPQTVRIQVREDGLLMDQIVLSPQTYLSTSPGALKNDTTILSKSSGTAAPSISEVLPNSGPTAGGAGLAISGQGFVAGATVKLGGSPASSVRVDSSTSISLVTPAHAAGSVTVVVTNPDGQSASRTNAYTYITSNQPPNVTIAASTTLGVAPLSVTLTANASDPDGSIATYNWAFGDGQVSTLQSVAHVYQTPGVFTATVTVTDNTGAPATASIPITVTSGPGVRVISPNGGEVFLFDSTVNITWSITGSNPTRQNVDLSFDGVRWSSVASALPGNARSFSWRVPRTASNTARIRVRAFDANGLFVDDLSNANFTIRKRP